MSLLSAEGNDLVFENGLIAARHSDEADNWILEFHSPTRIKLDNLWREWLTYNRTNLQWEHTLLIGRAIHYKDHSIKPYILTRCTFEFCSHCSDISFVDKP